MKPIFRSQARDRPDWRVRAWIQFEVNMSDIHKALPSHSFHKLRTGSESIYKITVVGEREHYVLLFVHCFVNVLWESLSKLQLPFLKWKDSDH